MLLWLGFAWRLTLALFDGLLHWGGAFSRTPKFRIRGSTGDWQTSTYAPHNSATWIGELLIFVYVCVALWLAVDLQHRHLIPLALGSAVGEVLMLGIALHQAVAVRRAHTADDRRRS
jgi:hypothetical protein